MKNKILIISVVIIGMVGLTAVALFWRNDITKEPIMPEDNKILNEKIIQLPEPKKESAVSIEQTLFKRKSVRDYTEKALTLEQVSQLLWAAQGITVRPDGRKGRTAPSAGALYPLEIFLTVRNVKGLDSGVYRFKPEEHQLEKIFTGDIQAELSVAALGQPWVAQAPINIVIAAVYERTTAKYGERGKRYVYIEVGHVGQNISLQAISLALGTVMVGAFDDEAVHRIVNLADNEVPLYIIPVGHPR